jgi:hypothetical protein
MGCNDREEGRKERKDRKARKEGNRGMDRKGKERIEQTGGRRRARHWMGNNNSNNKRQGKREKGTWRAGEKRRRGR